MATNGLASKAPSKVSAKGAQSKKRQPSKKAPSKRIGRPSDFTPDIGDAICALIADGKSVRKICQADDMPAMSTVFKWLREHTSFSEQYVRAREAQADKYAEEVIEIADFGLNDTYVDEDGKPRTDHDVIARSKLRVDARKWYASKLAPKKYGEKVAIGGADDLPPIAMQNAKDLTDDELAVIAGRGGARAADKA